MPEWFKGLDSSSNSHLTAWVRVPLLAQKISSVTNLKTDVLSVCKYSLQNTFYNHRE